MGAFLSFLGIETRSGSFESAGGSSPLPGVIPPLRSDARSINLDTGLSLPAVYRAIFILAGAVSQLELDVWRNGDRVLPKPALARNPDADATLSQFLKRTVVGLAGTGNAYWRMIDGPRSVSSIEILDPLQVRPYHDGNGRKRFAVGDKVYSTNEVRHLRLLEVPGHIEGLGPIQACRSGLNSALSLREYADNWFSDSAIPTGVLSLQTQLTDTVATETKRRWEEVQASRGVAVLGNGAKYEPILLSPADAQFIESQHLSVTTVAQMFGIPAPFLLAAVQGNSMTYTNMEQANNAFVTYTLMAYVREIEDALSAVLVNGQTAKFDLSGFLRPDAKGQSEIDKTYVDMGVKSPQEVRDALGLPGRVPTKPKPLAPVVAAPPAAQPQPDQEVAA
jgi:HK97 family phage portal protein